MAVNYDPYGTGKYTGPNASAVNARAAQIYAQGGSSKQSAMALAVFEQNNAAGNTTSNQISSASAALNANYDNAVAQLYNQYSGGSNINTDPILTDSQRAAYVQAAADAQKLYPVQTIQNGDDYKRLTGQALTPTTNQDNLSYSQSLLKAQADARSAAGIRNVGLITAAGFALPLSAAAAAGGLAGAGAIGETGLSAGNAAGLGTFAGHAALTGALTGAAGGYVGGGGLKGALIGGGLGALSGGFGGGAATSLGLDGANAGAFTGGLNGLAGGIGSGKGIKGDLIGAGLGAAGGYVTSGGLGSAAGTPGTGSSYGPTQGTGILGSATRTFPSLAGSAGTAGSLVGKSSNLTSIASPILSAGLSTYSQNQAVGDITDAEKKNKALLTPFLNEQFSPGDLTQTPGYQFTLDQANQAGDRKDAATGNYYSGAALKESQDRAAGLASQTYNDAYNQFLQTQQQKLGAAAGIGGYNDAIGSAQANAAIGTGNTLAQSGSAVLGALGGGNKIYNPSTGQYYDPSTSNGLDLASIKKLLGIG